MHCDLGWRQREDQPPVTGVDRLVLQHVAEKRSVSLGVLAVDDDVSAVNHAPSVPAHETPPNPPLQTAGRVGRPSGSLSRPPLNGSIVDLRMKTERAGLKSERFTKATDEELLAIVIDRWQQVLEREGRAPRKDDLKACGFTVSEARSSSSFPVRQGGLRRPHQSRDPLLRVQPWTAR